MKKIERKLAYDSNRRLIWTLPEYCTVLNKDLDELEQQRDEAVEVVRAFFMYPNYKRELVEGNNVISFLENAYGQKWGEIKADNHD